MSFVNFEDNFATNLTSNQAAGVTTTPLDSIPSVDVPFYLAIDTTNVNSKYEVVYVTSKTATHVNHAATTYAHTTAEEVRMIVPSRLLNALQNPSRGVLINGKISVTDVAGITVAIKTLAGTDPSVSDPVYARIGDTIRAITAALSVAKADATNWFNSGSTELATKEIDYFVYLGYNATDGVVIGFSRIIGNEYDDFSTTTTNEKYCAISTITTAAAGDDYEVIGRFAATLSAGAGYTWSVPTFTNKNLTQRPIYETRWLTWLPVGSANGAMTVASLVVSNASYKIKNNSLLFSVSTTFTTGGTASYIVYHTLPITVKNDVMAVAVLIGDPGSASGFGYAQGVSLKISTIDGGNWTLGAGENVYAGGEVEIA